MNPFNTALFKTPKWSTFDHSSSNKLSWSIGNLIPIKKYFLNAGERIQQDLGQLTRFNPLQAPVMDQYDLTVDAFFVPCRVLQSQVKDGVFTKFWNYTENLDGTYRLPMLNVLQLLENVNQNLPFDCPLSESLYDYLGYPTFPNVYRMLMDWYPKVIVSHNSEDSEDFTDSFDWLPTSRNEMYTYLQNFFNLSSDVQDNSIIIFDSLEYQLNNSVDWTTHAVSHPFVYTFIVYLLRRYYGLELNFNSFVMFTVSDAFVTFTRELRVSGAAPDTNSVIDWTKFFNYKKIDSDSVFKAYYNYLVYGLFLEVAWSGDTQGLVFYGLAQTLSGLDSVEVNDIYLRAYWRIVADWYTNLNVTGFTNDEQYADYIYGDNSGNETFNYSDFVPVINAGDVVTFVPFKRNWKNDYFTSAFPNPQSGTAVNIPTNGTITDLRASAIWQKIKEKALYAGKRAIDTWRAVFGVKSSNARYDMSEPIRRLVFNVDINAITQTNQSDIDNQLKTPVASWSGQGVSAGSRHFIDYTCEEPGIVMILASVTPRASYFQGLDKFLTKGTSLIDDYIYPEMSKVGEQPVKRSELFYDVNIDGSSIEGGTFGYTRRYGEFMWDRSEVHGEFKTSLDYWHSARKFDVAPSLGLDFLQVDSERDNLNRVFATSNPQNIYSYFFFDTRIVRPIPKYIDYEL